MKRTWRYGLTDAWERLRHTREEYANGTRNALKEEEDAFKAKQEAERKAQEISDANNKSLQEKQMKIMAANQALEILNKTMNVFKQLLSEANEMIEISNNQFNQEFLSGIKLHNVLGASEQEINSMYEYAKSLENVGIVSDEATLAGVSQLSVYTDNYNQVEKLIPAILDLAVSENGLNTSQSNVASTASMVGRALEGSATMLKRHGVITDAQAKALDSMTDKTQKASYLFEIMESKVGGVNEALAKTSRGSIIQARNSLNDLKEQIGNQLVPYLAQFEQILVNVLTPAVEWFTKNASWLVPILISVGVAVGLLVIGFTIYTAVTSIANFVTAMFGNTAMITALKISLIVIVIAILVGVLIYLWNTNDDVAYWMLFAWDMLRIGIKVAALGIQAIWYGLQFAGYALLLGLQTVCYYIAMAFNGLYIGVQTVIQAIVTIFQNMVNAVIDGINLMIDAINLIPGVNIEKKNKVTWAQDYAIHRGKTLANAQNELDTLNNNRTDTMNKMQDVLNKGGTALAESSDELANYVNDLNSTREDRVKNRQKLEVTELGKGTAKAITDAMNDVGLPDLKGVTGNGGKAVKTTTDDKLLSDEDIQLLLDVATRDYKLNYQQVTPQITMTFGDIRETADVDIIAEQFADRLEEIIDGNLEVVRT